ncbi:hypothetical protein [Pseudoruegeria sp. HB172150]|nr:hypothetical protein [Pseudoruegeria sp. HB172150]
MTQHILSATVLLLTMTMLASAAGSVKQNGRVGDEKLLADESNTSI